MNAGICKITAALGLALMVGACGVKSSPSAPEGSTFPNQYPAPLPELKTTPQKGTINDGSAPVIADPKSFWQYPNTPPGQ